MNQYQKQRLIKEGWLPQDPTMDHPSEYYTSVNHPGLIFSYLEGTCSPWCYSISNEVLAAFQNFDHALKFLSILGNP